MKYIFQHRVEMSLKNNIQIVMEICDGIVPCEGFSMDLWENSSSLLIPHKVAREQFVAKHSQNCNGIAMKPTSVAIPSQITIKEKILFCD